MEPKFWFYVVLALTLASAGGVVYYQIRESGIRAAEEKQRESNEKAKDRIKAVPPADYRSTIVRLQQGSY